MILSGGELVLADTSPGFGRVQYFPSTGIGLSQQFASYAAIYRKQLWVNIVVDKLALGTARLPLKVYERDAAGDRHEARDSDYGRLMREPNPKHDKFFFWLWTASTKEVYGEALWVKIRDAAGIPRELWPLHPVNVYTENEKTDAGVDELAYYVTHGSTTAARLRIPERDVVHFKSYNPDTTVRGMSKIEPLRQTLLNEDAARRATSAFWSSGARPAVALKSKLKLSPAAKESLKKSWNAVTAGADNTGATVVLEEGMEAERLSLTAEEAQYIECVASGTRFTMADGGLRPVEEIGVGNFVLAWDETSGTLTSAPVAAVRPMPPSSLLRVTTDRGRTLVTTMDHPYLASRRQRTAGGRYPKEHLSELATWIPADHLRVGDYVRVGLGDGLPPRGAFMDSWLLGALIGNGHNRRVGSIGFTTPSPEVADRLTRAVDRWNVKVKATSGVDFYLSCGRHGPTLPPFKRWLDDQGILGHNAHEKIVPQSIFEGGPDSWTGFVSGHFDTDGTVAHPNYRNPHIRWDSVSSELIDGIQHLLTLLGIQSSRRRHRSSKDGEPYEMWQVQVTGLSQVARVAAVLDSAYPEKAARLEFWANYQGSQVEYHPDLFLFDRIQSVEPAGEGVTWGVEVKDLHTHVTEGLVTHNTRKLNREEVASAYDIPPPVVHILDRATFSNITAQMRSMYRDTMAPRLGSYESVLDKHLRPDFGTDTQYAEFLLEEVLRGDFEARADAQQKAVNSGQRTPNEMRALDNLPPMPGGDKLYINTALVPLEQSSDDPKQQARFAADVGMAVQRLGLGVNYNVLSADEARTFLPGVTGPAPGPAPVVPDVVDSRAIDRKVAAKVAARAARAATLDDVNAEALTAGLNGMGAAVRALLGQSKAAGDDVPTFCALIWALAGGTDEDEDAPR